MGVCALFSGHDESTDVLAVAYSPRIKRHIIGRAYAPLTNKAKAPQGEVQMYVRFARSDLYFWPGILLRLTLTRV